MISQLPHDELATSIDGKIRQKTHRQSLPKRSSMKPLHGWKVQAFPNSNQIRSKKQNLPRGMLFLVAGLFLNVELSPRMLAYLQAAD